MDYENDKRGKFTVMDNSNGPQQSVTHHNNNIKKLHQASPINTITYQEQPQNKNISLNTKKILPTVIGLQ